jgi:hypothetical protein
MTLRSLEFVHVKHYKMNPTPLIGRNSVYCSNDLQKNFVSNDLPMRDLSRALVN